MFRKVTEHIYIYPCDGYTDRPNIGLILGQKRALLYDAGNSAAHAALMQEALQVQGLPSPDLIALSHWHWDHSFAMAAWDVPTIACKETNDQLKRVQHWTWDDQAMEDRVKTRQDIAFCNEMIKREYPDRSLIRVVPADIQFEEELTLDLGGVTCRLIRARGPHASDSVICHVVEDHFLFLGDSNCKDLYGLPWHFDIEHEEDFIPTTDALPYDRAKTDAFLALLEQMDFTHCISGHSPVKSREAQLASLRKDH